MEAMSSVSLFLSYDTVYEIITYYHHRFMYNSLHITCELMKIQKFNVLYVLHKQSHKISIFLTEMYQKKLCPKRTRNYT